MSASRHWSALDDVVSRLLPKPGVRHARERLAHRAAALTDIYVTRFLKTVGEPATNGTSLMRHIQELQQTHRALTAVLTRAWTRDQGPDPGQ
jgi:hypothetical protein